LIRFTSGNTVERRADEFSVRKEKKQKGRKRKGRSGETFPKQSFDNICQKQVKPRALDLGFGEGS
jgi:tRNA G46 methylase TrmB